MGMTSEQRAQLAVLCPTVKWDVDMAAYSTFRAGGRVEAMVKSGDTGELAVLLRWLGQEGIPWRAIGGGSNILVVSRYYEGVFIRLAGSTADIVMEPVVGVDGEGWRLSVSAGCSLASLVTWCTGKGLTGLEFMAGIPGSVGGAVRMNAGAFGHAIDEILAEIECITERGEVRRVARPDMVCGYRATQLPGEPNERLLLTRGDFILERADQAQLAARCRDIMARRRQRQPRGVGSAGSFFKNPEGDFAGRLIEQAGLKGLTRGKAMVSPKHANFIVNTGGAAPEDIVALMEEVRCRVFAQSGVLLEPEVHIL